MADPSFDSVTVEARDVYRREGVVCLRGIFRSWVPLLRRGVARNREQPGPYFAENVAGSGAGSFWDDYCNWQRIPEFERFLRESDMARLAAGIMGSEAAQLFHDHVLVKEPGTSKPTPWHQDSPYYFIDGSQTVSFWLPLDRVARARSLRLVAGSHLRGGTVRPVKWLDDSDFYTEPEAAYDDPPVGEQDVDGRLIRAWSMQPGDAVLFHFRTLHGALGNESPRRRRAFSVRWVGDDARYVERPGRTSPPFPGHDMRPGQRLREDWFPVLWPPDA